MLFWILLFVIVVVAIIGLLTGFFAGNSSDRGAGFGVFAGAIVIGLILTVIFSVTTVGARSVGIQTAFGKFSGTVQSGLHFVAPWSSVEEFSTLTQNLHLNGGSGDSEGPKTPVAFKGGASGNVDTTIRWRISDTGAEKLWRDYKTFQNVQDNLVRSDAQNSIRIEFSNFTPVDARDGNNLNTIINNVKNSLQQKLTAYGVTVDSIQVTNVELGVQAQRSIDRIVEANANTQRAQAEQDRARIDAETARIRQSSNTPQTLQRYCLDVVNNWDKGKNGDLPATFNCNFGASGQAQVLVGVK